MYSSGYAECGHGTISHEPFIPQAGTMEREREADTAQKVVYSTVGQATTDDK
ncbi:Uncharacterized protein APZ42_027858 [Daphnia magna]|uniref:Uncharacterized protein n=1 Tax=Daphnia magna TaxID=35525 RepID=A0A164R0L3_9CRUS|nr:Uncharacterized protein APZ42_027858 [Daphnia magna]